MIPRATARGHSHLGSPGPGEAGGLLPGHVTRCIGRAIAYAGVGRLDIRALRDSRSRRLTGTVCPTLGTNDRPKLGSLGKTDAGQGSIVLGNFARNPGLCHCEKRKRRSNPRRRQGCSPHSITDSLSRFGPQAAASGGGASAIGLLRHLLRKVNT